MKRVVEDRDNQTAGTRVFRLGELTLEAGGVLADAQIAYETYGTLNAEGTNAVLVCHALTGDAHAYGEEGQTPGWWQGLIGPGRALDTNRYYIICSNVLGSCNGSTGPQSLDPQTGAPYGSRFPLLTIRDMVYGQRLLMDGLGVQKLHMVIGGSMGGLQVSEWMVTYPDFMEHCVIIGSGTSTSSLVIAVNDVMRTAIQQDPNWQNGDYYGGERPEQGLALARKLGMITYRSFELFEERFGRDVVDASAPLADTRFQMQSYLDHTSNKLVGRFDPGSYMCLMKAVDLHDIGRGRGGFDQAAAAIRSKLLWIGIDSDCIYPVVEQRTFVERLLANGVSCSYRELHSRFGHDAFLLEFDQLESFIREFQGEN